MQCTQSAFAFQFFTGFELGHFSAIYGDYAAMTPLFAWNQGAQSGLIFVILETVNFGQ
jgi:hypothetical protein